MLITPTRDQMVYLASIGVDIAPAFQPDRVATPRAAAKAQPGPGQSPGSSAPWGVIVLVALMAVVLLGGLAQAQENPAPTNATGDTAASTGGGAADPSLDKIRGQITALREAVGQRLAALDPTIEVLARDRDRLAEDLLGVELGLQTINNSLHALDERLTDNQANDEAARRTMVTDLVVLRRSVQQDMSAFQRSVTAFVTICILLLVLSIASWMIVERRVRELEHALLSQPAASCPDGCNQGRTGDTNPVQPTLGAAPGRVSWSTPPDPSVRVAKLVASARKLSLIRSKPSVPTAPWSAGLATATGHVRPDNQDYGLCFSVRGHDVVVVADGVGGLPHGQRAAYLAAVSAAVSVLNDYGSAARWYKPTADTVAARAIMKAEHRLAIEGDKLNIAEIRGGLRTTLIVVIANQREVGYAYVGDGGGCVLTAAGDISRFLCPQKADGCGLNVLAASLGPAMEGEPVTGTLKRAPGDLILVGTDGVFDRVEPSFPLDVRRCCLLHGGDLSKAAQHVVEELAAFKDEAGYICDDNLTLAILGDRAPCNLPADSSLSLEAVPASAEPGEARPTRVTDTRL